jgi:hypothetical protein
MLDQSCGSARGTGPKPGRLGLRAGQIAWARAQSPPQATSIPSLGRKRDPRRRVGRGLFGVRHIASGARGQRAQYTNRCRVFGGARGLRQGKNRRRAPARPQRDGALGGPSGDQDCGRQAAAARRAPSGTKGCEGNPWGGEHQAKPRSRRKDGAPARPNAGDRDAIYASPRTGDFLGIAGRHFCVCLKYSDPAAADLSAPA